MKRILLLLLTALLLTGCKAAEVPNVEVPETETPAAATVEQISLYDTDSEAEQQTGGAVRAYPLGDDAESDLTLMGDRLLVVFDDGILTALQGEKGQVAATGMGSFSQDRGPGELAAWDGGVLYFDPETREVALMDTKLRENLKVELPEESRGNPVLQSNGDIFYCTETEIRSLNIHTGISRLVRQHNCVSQELIGSFFGDSIIGCRITDEAGLQRTIYLYAETGEAVQTDTAGFTMDTWEDQYFAIHTEEQKQYVFGTLDTEPMCLYPAEENVASVLPMNGAVGYAVAEDGLHLNFYDLTSGLRTSEVILPQMEAPQSIISDGTYVWFTSAGILYRWDVTMTAITDETVYTELRYTRENPNAEGLIACQDRVQTLRDTYGIALYIWKEAEELAADHVAEEEYRVSVINDALDQIEALLKQFPEDFVRQVGDVSFYMVKTLENGQPQKQYWDGASCRVVFSTKEPAKSFLIGLGTALDTKILGNSREFDNWDNLNPKGFKYTYDYEKNAQRETVKKYLDAFIDQDAMSFPTEDRSRIFAYALLPEGAEYFTHKELQNKLIRMCEGIRETFDWEKSSTVFPWEQYLKKSIAYQS